VTGILNVGIIHPKSIFHIKSLYNKELFCTFASELGYGGGDTQSPRLLI